MKSFFRLLVLAAVAGILSCSRGNTQTEVDQVEDVKITRSVVTDADASKCTAKITLDGMSCAKACGGKIKKCLKNIDGIKTADIHFDPERKTRNFATIEFDQKVVTEKEMIAAIEKLNNGQYKVKSVEIVVSEVSYEKIDKEEDKKGDKITSKVTALNNISIAIPSIFGIVAKVIQQ